MKLLTADEFQARVARSGWARMQDGRIVIGRPAVCYETSFELSGIVGADLSQLILNEFMQEQIGSGVLQVIGAFAASNAQYIVINHILSLLGYRSVPIKDFRFEFSEDYFGLITTMSWCLACGWEFDFLASGHHFGARTGTDESLAVFWREDEPTKPTVDELIKNLELTLDDCCFGPS